MTETDGHGPDGVRWSSRLAAVGLSIAVSAVAVASLGVRLPPALYWLGIAVSLGGVAGGAAYGSRSSGMRYGAGVLSALIGVLVAGYGVESGVLPAVAVGIVAVVVGTVGVIADARRST